MTPSDRSLDRIIERRKHRRSMLPPGSLLSFSPVTGSSDSALDAEGEGILLDLSQGGCRVSSESSVVLEQPYTLIIQLPDFRRPVTVESAIARWKGTQIFGVMFIAMHREQEQSLNEFLRHLHSSAA
ncbi:MAG: PilZ domain-containing protein [Nitrospira sp.]|nr:PilZ domain-containing protein [Nitrospira sp.]